MIISRDKVRKEAWDNRGNMACYITELPEVEKMEKERKIYSYVTELPETDMGGAAGLELQHPIIWQEVSFMLQTLI